MQQFQEFWSSGVQNFRSSAQLAAAAGADQSSNIYTVIPYLFKLLSSKTHKIQ